MAPTCALRAVATPAVLDEIQDLLGDLWADAGNLDSPDRLRFECAVVETAANIIEHSRPDGGRVAVTLTVELAIEEKTLRATLSDDGRPSTVDLDAVSMPDEDAECGRGLALATAASDLLGYVRNGTLNRWTVECVRSAQRTAPEPTKQ